MMIRLLDDCRSIARITFVGVALTIAGCGASSSTSAGGNGNGNGSDNNNGGDNNNVSASCMTLYANTGGLTLVSGTTAHNEAYPTVTKPDRGVSMLDETFGTCRIRAADHQADGLATFARNDYSRRQAFNADSTRYLIYASNGSWHLYDAATYTRVGLLSQLAGDAEPQWHPTDPNLLYYIPRNGLGMTLNELNVSTGVSTVVADLGDRLTSRWPTAARAWTRSEGSPSADARYWAFMVEDESFNTLGFITYDLQSDQIIAHLDIGSYQRPDHLSMTPSGKFVVVSWYGNTSAAPGATVFNRDFTNPRLVNPSNPIGEHSDIALDADGNDVFVSVDVSGGAATGDVYMVTITDSTLARINLFNIWPGDGSSTAVHISGKSFSRPGWALISTYGERTPKNWTHRKVLAVELKANPAIYHLAHTHRVYYAAYATETQGTVNRNFTKILFNSNWDVSSDDVDAYMLELPGDAL